MNDDFLFRSVNARLGIIDATQQRLAADIAEARQYGNEVEAGECIQRLANLDAEKRNLQQTRNDYIKANQPAPFNPDAWRSKRVEEMTPNDAFAMINATSKYAKMTPEEYRAGYAETQRRKANGEIQS
jgi:hypothetical protein